MEKLRKIKVNLFPRVPHLCRRRRASSSISCIETLSFLFLLCCGRSAQRRIDPPEAVLCRLWEDRSPGARHRLPPTSLFPALFRTRFSYYSSFNHRRDGFFALRWFYRRHERALVIDIAKGCVLSQSTERERERETLRFPIRSCGDCGDDGESKISISRRW